MAVAFFSASVRKFWTNEQPAEQLQNPAGFNIQFWKPTLRHSQGGAMEGSELFWKVTRVQTLWLGDKITVWIWILKKNMNFRAKNTQKWTWKFALRMRLLKTCFKTLCNECSFLAKPCQSFHRYHSMFLIRLASTEAHLVVVVTLWKGLFVLSLKACSFSKVCCIFRVGEKYCWWFSNGIKKVRYLDT